MDRTTGVPRVLGLCAAGLVVGALTLLPTVGVSAAPTADEHAVPRDLAAYSHLTGSVSSSAPGPAVALFQHGWGVEFLDFPQAVVLGAGGDTYRRVDLAEDRAGAETQGDPAPMLLSPDGRWVAVGDHDSDDPDVAVVDLTSGEVSTHPLPQGRSVVPVAWTADSGSLAVLLSDEPTNPYSGQRITGDAWTLDLGDGSTTPLAESGVTAVAFSPDGRSTAVERSVDGSVSISVVDDAGDERQVEADGLLAGPTAWSPDGRLLATTIVGPSASSDTDEPGSPTGLAFVDATGAGGEVADPLLLDLPAPGRVLAWTGDDEVVALLDVESSDVCCGPDTATLSAVPLDGSTPRTLMTMHDLTSYGVGRFQLAADAGPDLQVVDPDDVDRGPWPWPWRIGAALVAGLAVWLLARVVQRVVARRRRVADRPDGAPAAAQLAHQR